VSATWQTLWDVPATPVIEELELAWAGGVADFGDPRAAQVIHRAPGYTKYRHALVRAAKRLPLVEFAGLRGLRMYRSMDRGEAEFLQSGGSLGARGFTFRREVAEGWRRFAGHTGDQDLVVVSAVVLPEAIVMRGKFGEAELVVDTGWVQDTEIVVTKNRRTSKRAKGRSVV
jgi:hypothetical protein